MAEGTKALILVDIQNDFLPGGALAVPHGDDVVPIANRMCREKGRMFQYVVATQDWHPPNHGSFASRNPGRKPGELAELGGLPQVMWPDHCVRETRGAEFAPALERSPIDHVVKKGTDPSIDSYSGFFDNGHRKATGLADWLRTKNVSEVFVLGLATDYCVKFTALDARQLGLQVTLIADGSRAVNLQADDETKAIEEMRASGVRVVTSRDLLGPN